MNAHHAQTFPTMFKAIAAAAVGYKVVQKATEKALDNHQAQQEWQAALHKHGHPYLAQQALRTEQLLNRGSATRKGL